MLQAFGSCVGAVGVGVVWFVPRREDAVVVQSDAPRASPVK